MKDALAGYRELALPRSSMGMFKSAPRIRRLNSAWSGVVELSTVAAAVVVVEGDAPAVAAGVGELPLDDEP